MSVLGLWEQYNRWWSSFFEDYVYRRNLYKVKWRQSKLCLSATRSIQIIQGLTRNWIFFWRKWLLCRWQWRLPGWVVEAWFGGSWLTCHWSGRQRAAPTLHKPAGSDPSQNLSPQLIRCLLCRVFLTTWLAGILSFQALRQQLQVSLVHLTAVGLRSWFHPFLCHWAAVTGKLLTKMI